MDNMTTHRKARLRELIDGPPYRGSQLVLARAAGMTPGRVSQLLRPDFPFGERSASTLASRLRLSDRFFDEGFEEPEEPVHRSIELEILRDAKLSADSSLLVRAHDDSNHPTIYAGGLVLIDKRDLTISPGSLYAYEVDKTFFIRRLTIVEGVGILATADNPAFKRAAHIYTDANALHMMGRVVWTGAPL